MKSSEEILTLLIEEISSLSEVQAIGISGGKSPIPKAGEGDIDIFIYCDQIPEVSKRKAMADKLDAILNDRRFSVFEGGHWGTGDFACINGVETWMMYFSITETLIDIDAILRGNFPDRLDNYYYPVGRCAMLRCIDIQFDRSRFLNSVKERLSKYPDRLADILAQYHLDKLDDNEDLERAVTRGDVLFYHFALDLALDHFLQALFAMNKTFFPSRKRNFEYIKHFGTAPRNCTEKLLLVLKSGGSPEGIIHSFALWHELVKELKEIHNSRSA